MDYNAVGVGLAAVITAAGTLVIGLKTGSNNRIKDENEAAIQLQNAQTATDLAIENATKGRIDALVADAEVLRVRLRKVEDEADERYNSLRRHAQRGWDLANFHFGKLALLAHLLNNIFQVHESSPDNPERVMGMVDSARKRMKGVSIPISLEEPLEPKENTQRA